MRALQHQWAAQLITFRRNGAGVATPVNLAVECDHAYFRTYGRAAKLKRIRRNPNGQVGPCSPLGNITGPTFPCRIRVLDGPEATHAERAIKRKHPIVQGVLVSLAHTLMREQSVYLQLTSVAAASIASA